MPEPYTVLFLIHIRSTSSSVACAALLPQSLALHFLLSHICSTSSSVAYACLSHIQYSFPSR
eukprot:360592-Pelagomonas_calceolata.AAC.2